jgi:iron complex outermembrane recepter protein
MLRLLTTTCLTACVFALPAAAQAPAAPAAPAAAEPVGEEEVVVTARKREERLQTVPLPVQAFTAKQIAERGLSNATDIAFQTPGFSFRSGFGRTSDRPAIRGMSNIQGVANASFFLDGVFIAGSVSAYGLDNLERIEVIKGPQSALFGRATFSGAINYITRKPTNEIRGRAKGTLGTDGLREYSAFVSGPIVEDKLFFDVYFRNYEFDGQFANVLDPAVNLGAERSRSFSLGLTWRPLEGLELSYRGTYSQDNDAAPPYAMIGRTFGQTFPLAPGILQTNGINCFQPQLTGTLVAGRPLTTTRARGYWCGAVPVPSVFAQNTADFRAAGFPDAIDRMIKRDVIKLSYDYQGWGVNAFWASNYRRQTGFTDQDYSDIRAAGFETFDRGGARDTSYDIRLSSPGDYWIRGQIGYYNYKERDNSDNFSGNLTITPPGQPSRSFRVGDDPNLIRRNAVVPSFIENWAVYGQLEVEYDKWRASVEVRRQEDTLQTTGVSTATVGATTFTRSLNRTVSFASTLPRFTLDYRVNDDLMIYAVAAKGNKPGGINTGAYGAIYTDQGVQNFENLGLTSFKEEEIWSYELGVKSAWFDNRLVVNASAYYIDWTNQQLTNTVAVPPTDRRDGVVGTLAFTTNAGKSEVKGFEIEAVGRPADWVELRLGYGYQGAKIVNFVNDDEADFYITAADLATLNANFPAAPPGSTPAQIAAATQARIDAANALIALRGNSAGAQLPRVPKHQLQLGAAFFYDVTPDIRLTWRTDYVYESKRYIQVDNLGWSKPMNLVNMRLSADVGQVTFTLFANNLFNDKSPTDVLRYVDTQQTITSPNLRGFGNQSFRTIRDFAVTPSRERVVGITAEWNF